MKAKRIFALLTAILMLICCMAISVSAGETFQDEYLSLQVPDNYTKDDINMTGTLTKGAYYEVDANGEETGDNFNFYILQNNITRMTLKTMQTEEMRQDIQNKLGIKAYDIYGLTEISGPGVSFECSEQTGMHVNEDHFIAEIIDPVTGEVLPEGEKGELVFTSISKDAFPLIRYRTRDICVLSRKKCSCGRTHVKMSKPMGRSDDMLIVKGVNVFPSQIETVLLNKGYPANYQIVVSRENNSDKIEVLVEMTPEMFSDTLSTVSAREKELVDALKAMLGIYAAVRLVSPKSITRSEGKAVRVIDKRKLY